MAKTVRFAPLAVAIAASLLAVAPGARSQAPAVRSAPAAEQDIYDQLRVGDKDPGRIVLPTNQILTPIGQQVVVGGRPTDVALSPDGRRLAVSTAKQLVIVDVESGKILGRANQGGSCKGLVFAAGGKKLLASNSRGSIDRFDVGPQGTLHEAGAINIPGPPQTPIKTGLPIGLALADERTLWAVLNVNNTLAEIDLAQGKIVREIPVGNAPYDVVLAGATAYVSNWAGRQPGPDDATGPSGIAARVRVDRLRHIASDGSVSVVDLATGKQTKEIVVGLHPSALALAPGGRYVCVTNANSDTVSVIDTRAGAVVETFSVRPEGAPPLFGSGPNALAFSVDGRTLYISNGTNNAIAVFAFAPPHCRWQGCFPTGWYPAGVVVDAARNRLCVANIKGVGSRSIEWQGRRKVKGKAIFGYNGSDFQGTVSLIPLPTAEELPKHSQQVLRNNRVARSIAALSKPKPAAAPRPVPRVAGEPSHFKHVLYIIKENRTYDQVFGDVERGEGDPSLCIFGREATPNAHKLVDEFVLLDNFYCSGVISADGHQWTDEAYVTDYIEKFFSGFIRSYPYDGDDALAYASSGFLWDSVLAHRKTLRVYGEFAGATIRWKDRKRKKAPTFIDCLNDFERKTGRIEVRGTAKIKTLEPYLCPTSIGFPSTVPDVYRAQQFLNELADFEHKGTLPNLMVMLLPADHTTGTAAGYPTPESSVADNDLALGRIVEAVSKSRFWKETCIFIVEDDPQNGFDHIDGHRTVAMVISPYSRLRSLDSTNYNQTSMVRTIELILGLPPMNQFDSAATPMASCFGAGLDLTPYKALPNNVPLDRLNPDLSQIRDPRQRHWAQVSMKLPLDDIDEADEDTLNRILWHNARGRDDTYPAWAVNAAEDEDE